MNAPAKRRCYYCKKNTVGKGGACLNRDCFLWFSPLKEVLYRNPDGSIGMPVIAMDWDDKTPRDSFPSKWQADEVARLTAKTYILRMVAYQKAHHGRLPV